MSENETERILKAVMDYHLLVHKLPWRIERDWSWEVIAKDGTVIAKCSNPELAREIVSCAERRQEELEEGYREVERMLSAGEI